MPKIYISGPISSNPGYVQEFADAEKTIRGMGYDVVNPVEITRHLLEKNLSPAELWRQCMIEDVKALKECDAIVLLDRKGLASRGMDVEIKIAVRFGIRIFTVSHFCLKAGACKKAAHIS